MTNINSVTTVASGTGAGTAAETVIATTPAISVGAQSPIGVLVRGWILFTPGTACTTLTIRCRQGSLAAPGLTPSGILAITVAAGVPILLAFSFLDTTTVPEQAGGVQYVVTTTPNGTGASTCAAQVTVEV
jgi:hypothetical protein